MVSKRQGPEDENYYTLAELSSVSPPMTIMKWISKRIGHRLNQHDVLQDTLTACVRELRSRDVEPEPESKILRSHFWTTLKQVLIQNLRKESRNIKTESLNRLKCHIPQQPGKRSETLPEDLLSLLSDIEQKVLKLRFEQGLNLEQTAFAISRHRATVCRVQKNALKRISAIYSNHDSLN